MAGVCRYARPCRCTCAGSVVTCALCAAAGLALCTVCMAAAAQLIQFSKRRTGTYTYSYYTLNTMVEATKLVLAAAGLASQFRHDGCVAGIRRPRCGVPPPQHAPPAPRTHARSTLRCACTHMPCDALGLWVRAAVVYQRPRHRGRVSGDPRIRVSPLRHPSRHLPHQQQRVLRDTLLHGRCHVPGKCTLGPRASPCQRAMPARADTWARPVCAGTPGGDESEDRVHRGAHVPAAEQAPEQGTVGRVRRAHRGLRAGPA